MRIIVAIDDPPSARSASRMLTVIGSSSVLTAAVASDFVEGNTGGGGVLGTL